MSVSLLRRGADPHIQRCDSWKSAESDCMPIISPVLVRAQGIDDKRWPGAQQILMNSHAIPCYPMQMPGCFGGSGWPSCPGQSDRGGTIYVDVLCGRGGRSTVCPLSARTVSHLYRSFSSRLPACREGRPSLPPAISHCRNPLSRFPGTR